MEIKGINGYIKSENDYLSKAQALPKNTNIDGNGSKIDYTGTNASIEVIVEVTADISIADTKTISIKLQHCDSESGVYADLATIYSKTASGAYTASKGEILGKYIIPDTAKQFIKAVLTTTDASATGEVSVYGHYIPR